MTPAAAAVLLAGLAGLLAGAPRGAALGRLDAAAPAPGATPGGGARRPAAVPQWLPRLLGGLAGCAALTSHGAAATGLAVLAVATGLPAVRRQRANELRQQRLTADLPRAAELLASCLDAGAAPAAALGAVAAAVGGPVGLRLGQVATVLAAGGQVPLPRPGSAAGPVDRLVATLARAAATGAPLAASVRDLAVDERERARWAATERARVAGVRAVGPLAACFLPAFVLVGVVPVVAGVAASLLGGS
jgi:Flp pilus assembly protein TadB